MLTDLKEERDVGPDNLDLEVLEQRAPAGRDIGYIHWHDETEWVYVVSGSIDVFRDGDVRRVRAGELFAVEPRALHRYSSVEDCHILVAVFDCALMEFARPDVTSRRFIQPYCDGRLAVENPVEDRGGDVGALFDELVETCRDASLGYQIVARTCLLRIFQRIVREGRLVAMERSRHSLAAAKLAVRFVQEHFAENISSRQLAEVSGYQAQYFSRFFKRATGLTPTAYITRYRVERACAELLDTDRSVADIGAACGFSSTSYFIKKFKEIKSVSPQRFRTTVLESYRAFCPHYRGIEVLDVSGAVSDSDRIDLPDATGNNNRCAIG